MAGRVDHVQRQPLDGELVAVGKPHRHHVGLGLLAHHGDAVGLIREAPRPVMWSACRCVSTAFTSLRSSS